MGSNNKGSAVRLKGPGGSISAVDFLVKYALYIMIIILVVIVTVKFPPGSKANFLAAAPVDLIKRVSYRIFLALGVGGIIVLTGTDLSAGRNMGLCACIAAALLQRSDYAGKMFPELATQNMFLVLLLLMVVGGLIGLVNGFCVSKFSLHPFIVTLATQLMIYGTVLIFVNGGQNKGQPLSGLDGGYTSFITGNSLFFGLRNPLGLPNYVWFAVLAVVIMWLIWNKTTLGKNMYAVGSNPEAAKVSGVNVSMTIILIFVMAGVLYGCSGFVEAARVGSNTATTGLNAELDAIAACVIGGVSFTGGVGKISGIVAGVFLLEVISVCLQWLSVSADMVNIIKGLIILVAVALDMRKYLAKK